MALLSGLGPETALGRIVAIRSETDKEVLKYYTPEQRKIRNAWRNRKVKKISQEEMAQALEGFKKGFLYMAGH